MLITHHTAKPQKHQIPNNLKGTHEKKYHIYHDSFYI